MKRKQIYRIYDNEGNKVSETACKSEIAWYRKNKRNYSFIKTGSFVISKI